MYDRFKRIPMPGERRGAVYRAPYDLPVESKPVNYSTGEVKTYGIGEDKAPAMAKPLAAQTQAPLQAPQKRAPALGNGLRQGITQDQIINYLLPKFRRYESSNDPTVKTTADSSDASGLYQYLSSTWNNYKGYKEARLAPPEIQEERMRADTLARLNKYNNDVFRTVAEHYYPKFAKNPADWDKPILDNNGNPYKFPRPTVREYLYNVLPKQYVDAYLRQRGL